jgi:hypothetical protein
MSKRKCIVTKLDISMQKDESKFLCISGVKFYQNNKPEIYKELENRLSATWKNESIKIRNTEIHHSIRNEYFNKFHNNKRDVQKLLNKPSLFDNRFLILPERLQLAGISI